MAVLNTGLATPSRGSFTLDQSLRFEDGSSPYLSWTPSSAGTEETWTFSCWVKRGNLGSFQGLLAVGTVDGSEDFFGFNGDDNLYFRYSTSSDLKTNAVYRDSSAHYHIVLVADTTQSESGSTASDSRLRLYVNGEQVTSFSSGTMPSQDHTFRINTSAQHYLGEYPRINSHLDGYLSEVHFIDGTALTPSSFGETGTYGEWKPIEVEGLTYGTNGFYLSFAGGGVMSATGGNSTATDGDYKAASFTSNGTFTPSADGYVEYLVIGGGGAGAASGSSASHGGAGGGGAGAYRTGYLPVTGGTGYSIVVGAGGAGRTYAQYGSGNQGASSSFSTITSTGGGGGSAYGYPAPSMSSGSSGGGGQGKSDNSSHAGGTGGAYGNNGGAGHAGGTAGAPDYGAGGGGGAGAVGADGTTTAGGNGGAGTASSITGSSVTRAGGGGGSTFNNQGTQGSGGSGGGGAAGSSSGTNGTANTGGGGGGAKDSSGATGGSGGSGIVILRYKFQ